MYDVIIIGAGPAGISAAIYAVSRGCKTLVLEQTKVGGLIGNVSTVTHYCGIIENETGATIASRMEKQALDAGVEIKLEKVIEVKLTGEIKEVQTANQTYQAKKIIIANGTTPRKLEIPGESKLADKGIGMNAFKDGHKYQGRHIYVVGGADGAIKEALYLAKFASKLTIIHFEDKLGCIQEFLDKIKQTPNITVWTKKRLKAVYGNACVEAFDLVDVDDGSVEHIEDDGCGIFVYAGSIPNSQLYLELDLQDGYIPVDENMETAIKGVYAVGDIRVKQIRQVSTAVSDGTIAAINAAKK